MAITEQMELIRHRSDLAADVRVLVDKYRAIFSSDVPDFDDKSADKVILMAIRIVLSDIEKESSS